MAKKKAAKKKATKKKATRLTVRIHRRGFPLPFPKTFATEPARNSERAMATMTVMAAQVTSAAVPWVTMKPW